MRKYSVCLMNSCPWVLDDQFTLAVCARLVSSMSNIVSLPFYLYLRRWGREWNWTAARSPLHRWYPAVAIHVMRQLDRCAMFAFADLCQNDKLTQMFIHDNERVSLTYALFSRCLKASQYSLLHIRAFGPHINVTLQDSFLVYYTNFYQIRRRRLGPDVSRLDAELKFSPVHNFFFFLLFSFISPRIFVLSNYFFTSFNTRYASKFIARDILQVC